MAGTLNKVILIGRLGQDPKLSYTPSGSPVAEFSLATDESYTDRQGQRQDKTEWHRIKVWDRQAEICSNYLAKGRLVYVEGRISTRKWQDQQGQDRYFTEIIAQKVLFLESRGTGAEAAPDSDYAPPPQRRAPTGQGGQGGYGNQNRRPAPQQNQPGEDLGPAFPSEAGGMDDVPF